MNKTVNINLNGLAFIINEDAYAKLKNYLNEIQDKYSTEKEVVEDIEARLAELFTEYLTKLNIQVLSIDDVNRAIEQIGEPDQMEEEEEIKEGEKAKAPRKLYRDTTNAVIGGVSSGLAEYIGLDVTIVRLLWVVAFFTLWGIAAIAYILFWIIVPVAKTPAQRLEMKGKEFTSENVQTESNYVLTQNNAKNGCVTSMGVGCLTVTAIFILVPLLFLFFIFCAMLCGLTAPIFEGMDSTLVGISLAAIIICPLAALIYLGVSLKDREHHGRKKNIVVYAVLLLLFVAGIVYFATNSENIIDNSNNWGSCIGSHVDQLTDSLDNFFENMPDTIYVEE